MSNVITEFPPEVIAELKYYVYRLIDPRNGETFYVGKGKGNRVFNHMRDAIESTEKDELSDKLSTIRDIHLAGLDVIHLIHRHGMEEATAFEVEAALIDAYPNATNIMGGRYNNDVGVMHSKEIIEKYKSEELEFHHKVIMINVNVSKSERSLYDATRRSWKINVTKAKQAEYVLAVTNGIVVGVFIPEKWLPTLIENFPDMSHDEPNRFGFIGKEANIEIKQLYLRKRIPKELRRKGAANPIRYNY